MSNLRAMFVAVGVVTLTGGVCGYIGYCEGFMSAEIDHAQALALKEAEYRAKEKELTENANLAWAKEAEARVALDRAQSDNSRLVVRVRELADRNADTARKDTGPCASIAEAKAESDALAAEGAELLAEVAGEYGKVVVQVDTLIDLQ